MIMRKMIRPLLVLFGLLTCLTGLLYPAAVTGLAQVLFPLQANGSVMVVNGVPVGSALIGQAFDDPRYFWGRPSATSSFPNNASASGGSNLSPTNPVFIQAVGDRVQALRAADPANTASIPVDLVTCSGSGLDPHISVASAVYQVGRVARARGLPLGQVVSLVELHIEGRQLGVLGEPRVNVLRLNQALDAVK